MIDILRDIVIKGFDGFEIDGKYNLSLFYVTLGNGESSKIVLYNTLAIKYQIRK